MTIDWSTVGNDKGCWTLHEDGQITWQADKTNPLPGDMVAWIKKGNSVLTPAVEIVDHGEIDDTHIQHIKDNAEKWIESHIQDVLAPLFRLKDKTENKLEGAAQNIGDQVFDNLGVVHRSEIEHYVPDLTPEYRATLRQNKIKMGPILVFMYELVKPAAINIRALLWGLWNGKSLPVERPADGRVSVMVDPKAVDKHYLRSIGYPVFGSLAIRIDMLDRVVTDIYDSSKDFKFQAQHKYMEWLGCGEDDLYAVLQSMGFRRLKEEKEQEKAENNVSLDENADKKDDLAVFLLKKGKISDRPRPNNSKKIQKTDNKRKKPKKNQEKSAKSYHFEAENEELDENSPFAILKQLQK